MTAGTIALGWLCGVAIIGLLITEGIALYLIQTRANEILGYFKNSPTLFAKKALINGGPYGKLVLIGDIARVVSFPHAHLKSGKLDADDLNSLPPWLRRTLKAIYWSLIGLLALGLLAVLLIKIELFN
jgi:hypothetical protein